MAAVSVAHDYWGTPLLGTWPPAPPPLRTCAAHVSGVGADGGGAHSSSSGLDRKGEAPGVMGRHRGTDNGADAHSAGADLVAAAAAAQLAAEAGLPAAGGANSNRGGDGPLEPQHAPGALWVWPPAPPQELLVLHVARSMQAAFACSPEGVPQALHAQAGGDACRGVGDGAGGQRPEQQQQQQQQDGWREWEQEVQRLRRLLLEQQQQQQEGDPGTGGGAFRGHKDVGDGRNRGATDKAGVALDYEMLTTMTAMHPGPSWGGSAAGSGAATGKWLLLRCACAF